MIGRNSKAIGSGVGASLAMLLVYLVRTFTVLEIPVEVEITLGVMLTTLVTWLSPANTEPPNPDAVTYRKK